MTIDKKSIDLIAFKDDRKIAFEIETGKNSKDQIIENIRKCMEANSDKIYLIATNDWAYRKIRRLLNENNLIYDPRLSLVRAKT